MQIGILPKILFQSYWYINRNEVNDQISVSLNKNCIQTGTYN